MVLFNLLKRKKRFAIGIDIGHSGLKVVTFHGEGQRGTVEKLHLRDFSPGAMDAGRVEDEGELVEALRELVREGLIPKGKMVASVPGGKVEVKRIRVPAMGPKEVDRYVAMEAEQAFTLPFLSLTIDYAVMKRTEEYSDLLVVGVPREQVTLARELFHKAGVDLHVLDVKPLALYHLFSFLGGDEFEGLSVVLDVGRSVTTMVLVMNGEVLCAREVYLGGDMITEMIQAKEGIVYQEAEKLKREEFSHKPYEMEILDKFVVSLGHELRLVLDSCRLWLEPGEAEVKRLFYTGGGASLKNFGRAFEEKFDVEARNMYYLNAKDVLGGRVEELDRYSVAVGLSVRGAVA